MNRKTSGGLKFIETSSSQFIIHLEIKTRGKAHERHKEDQLALELAHMYVVGTVQGPSCAFPFAPLSVDLTVNDNMAQRWAESEARNGTDHPTSKCLSMVHL